MKATEIKLPLSVTSLYGETKLESRPYQIRVVTRTIDHYVNGGIQSVLIESPTGSGKTSMALITLLALKRIYPDLEIGWVSMRKNLLAQAEKENREKGINVPIHFLSMFTNAIPDELRDRSKKRLLVCDEAQHDCASSMAHLHSQIEAEMVLGMTATPFRSDRAKLCFSKIVKDAGLATLIKDGWLSQYDHYTIPKYDVPTVAETYIRDRDKWGKSVMYFHTVQQCHEMDAALKAAGIRSDVVTGDSDREKQLDDFRSDATDVLVNCMVLTEGFDAPSIKSVFCKPSCKGVTIQMAGRAFRKFPGLAAKNIVQSENTKWPLIKSIIPRDSYVWRDNTWLALSLNPQIERFACRMVVALANIVPKIPKYLRGDGKKGKGRRRRRVIRFGDDE